MLLLTIVVMANEPTVQLERNCLACHLEQKIPSELMYRRYLIKYSTQKSIKKRLFEYLKKPKKEKSIMPTQFFLKFPEKEQSDLNETLLKESIEAYLAFFDVKRKLLIAK